MEQELMGDFQWTDHGASDAAIDAAEAELGVKLPADYLAVIRAFDGGEGFVGEGAYLRLWPVEDLVERNRVLDAARLVPGEVLIGTDGADDLYAVEPSDGTYATYPAVGLSASLRRRTGGSWDEFLKVLSEM